MKALLKNHNLYIVFTITLLAVMGVASITPAFPTIARHFDLNISEIGMLITAFTIPGIFMAPLMGVLADRLGRKTVLIPSLGLFGLMGAACALSGSFEWLLVFRVFQGLGAASLSSLNVTLIGDLFSGNRRATAMGYNASVLSVGTASYPAIGGALALLDWRLIFYLPLLALPVAFAVFFYLETNPPKKRKTVKEFMQTVWKTINRQHVWGIFMMNILVFIMLYGAFLTFIPTFLEKTFNSNSFEIGIIMSVMSVTTAIMASQLGKVSRTFRKKQILYLSGCAYIVALALLAFAPSRLVVVVAVIFYGLGQGLIIPTIQTMLAGIATVEERASLMSVNSMVLRIGQSLGPVVMTLFFINQNFTLLFLAAAGIGVVVLSVNLLMVKEE